MTTLELGGRGEPRVVVSFPERLRTEWPNNFSIAVDAEGLRANTTVENPPYAPALASFIEEIANSHAPWAETFEWGSIEGELKICASCDATGHVQLEFKLSPGHGMAPGWSAVATITVELGTMESIARELTELFRYERP